MAGKSFCTPAMSTGPSDWIDQRGARVAERGDLADQRVVVARHGQAGPVVALAGHGLVGADEHDDQVGGLDRGLGRPPSTPPGAVAVVEVPQASKVTVAAGLAALTAAVIPCTALTCSVGSPE